MRATALVAATILATTTTQGSPTEAAPPEAMALVRAGVYRPLFPPSPRESTVAVRPFRIDRVPVTNGVFLAFVQAHTEWRRDRVARVFAEPAYLGHWAGAEELGGAVSAEQPVVDISWFAARAYCSSRGLRLPTEAEWEVVASASRTQADGMSDPSWRAEIFALYSSPAPARLPDVGAGAPNFWGVRDLHGLVWEWVSDFAASVTAVGSDSDRLRFCGAVPGEATDLTDFAAFERVALRNSLQASYVTRNLGFRCAGDVP